MTTGELLDRTFALYKEHFQIARRIKAKTGLQLQPGETIDDFLETVARQIRDGTRFS